MSHDHLPIPEPGRKVYVPNYVDPDTCGQASADILRAHDHTTIIGPLKEFLVGSVDSQLTWKDHYIAFEEDSPDPAFTAAHQAREAIVSQVVSELEISERGLTGYSRVIGQFSPRGGLSLHRDICPDLRVLVDVTGGAKWIFGPSAERDRHPKGLVLNQGDAVVLNNECPPESQLLHGVQLLPGVARRVSFLLNFE